MLTPIEIAKLEEARQAVGVSEIAIESEPINSGRMAAGEVGSWQNYACGLGLDGPVTGAEIDRLIEFYESRGSEPKIEVCPFADESLIHGLYERGFGVKEFEAVYARDLPPDEDLEALKPDVTLADGRRVVVERIDPNAPDAEALTDINSRVGMSGFVEDGEPITQAMLDIGQRMLRHERTTLANAYAVDEQGEKEPVAAYGMESAPPVAAFFGVTVLEPYRRRGIQRLLLIDRLMRAREHGCVVACIHSKPGIPTERNAMRVGFRLVYHKVVMTQPGEGLMPSR